MSATVRRRLAVLVAAGLVFMTLGTYFVVDQPALANTIWREVFLASWLSWLSAIPVWTSLILMRKRIRVGFLAYAVAAGMLIASGLLLRPHQWGFCAIGVVNVFLAGDGWRSWGKPHPAIEALERENAELRAENEQLRAGRGRAVVELVGARSA